MDIKWIGQNDDRVKDETEWQRWRIDKCVGIDDVGGFDEKGDEALSTPQMNFVT